MDFKKFSQNKRVEAVIYILFEKRFVFHLTYHQSYSSTILLNSIQSFFDED